MARTLEYLVKRIREELRAEGPMGGGYSDFFIIEAVNSALEELAEVFTIRDTLEFTTSEGLTTYVLSDEFPNTRIDKIIRVEYDDKPLTGIVLDEFLSKTLPAEGSVNEWTLWGETLILVGEIEENKTIKLWVTVHPTKVQNKNDEFNVPSYADEAVAQYAISACYRQSKDYERANYHYNIFLTQKNLLLKRDVPQGQRDYTPVMRDSYWGPVSSRDGASYFIPGGF